MKADFVYHEKKYLRDGAIKEIKIWRIPDNPPYYKYSLVYIVNEDRAICYDNAHGKGDHKHYRDTEHPYRFQGIEKLLRDFENDIRKYKEGKL